MQPHTSHRVWTIGHSSMSVGEFVGLLQANGIDLVVDVRTAPYSRFASQFNKPDLAHALEQVGITYRYEGERLGGRPNDPTCYRSGAIPEHAERAEFLKLVDYDAVKCKPWFQQALAEIIDLADHHRIALMCSEEDPKECHRHRLIASALNEHDVEVIHIRRNGSTVPAVFSDDALFVQAQMF